MDHDRPPPPQEPLKFTASASSIAETGDALCDAARDTMRKLVLTVTPETASFQNVMRVLLELENEFQLTSNVIGIYARVAPDADLRSAAAKVIGKISQFLIENKADRAILRLVEAVFQKQSHDKTLDSESRKALAEERRSRQRSAISCPDGKDESCLGRIQRRLKNVEAELVENLDEHQHCLWLTREDLSGVPEDILRSMERGTGELNGSFGLDLNGMQARLRESIVSSSATRRTIYLATRRVSLSNCEATFTRKILSSFFSASFSGLSP
ncbi:hypothetical protein F5B22DRAFT_135749 [Xylaria bambusicola]|uniref:uncharacterized protein n=1 Tax=Xylaria bambusicola TaxID=326684 RepID=UPI0020076D91|nr:uncharacterized protein F5B22DRAFT_135749 [Xylaria bambusicola]KAI0517222.1 hypothetical protein F5B22DRAFT_135749 [Xylaria bambusicola]